ncbi:PilN domain-containing protein [Neisseriaceae bacterium B1]
MNLIKINLLPYREIREQKQKKQFQQIMLLGAAAGLVLSGLIWSALEGAISNQNSRNESLESGIKQLDSELAEIKTLNEQKQNFLARKQKVEELDVKRFEGARVLDTLDQITPEGTYLVSITPNTQNGVNLATGNNAYIINGKAVSDNKIALFMTALPSTGMFEQPELQSIKKGDDAQEFSLSSKLVEQKIAQTNAASQTASTPSEGNNNESQ